MNLGASLYQAAIRWPNKTALVFEGQRWTYVAFNRLVNKAAHAFRAHGVTHGDRVGFLTPNLPEQVIGYYALLKLGAIPVPINYRLAANEVKYILDDCAARLLVFEDALRSQIDPVAADLASVERLIYIGDTPAGNELPFDQFINPGAEDEPHAQVLPDDSAFIMYTSGTTGPPKGVVRTHRAELLGAMAMVIECGFRHGDIVLANSPLFHIGQLQLQFIPFVQIGGTNVLTRGFDIEETLTTCATEQVTVLHGVPTQLVMLMDADFKRYDLSALRIGFFGGQTLADDVVRRCLSVFPAFFANLYGSTEALLVTACDYRRHPGKLGSAGQAVINMDVRVVAPETNDVTAVLSPGEVGELITRGPTLMREYWGLPEKTQTALAQGWYRTGDAAVPDDDGFVTVLGRLDHTIKSGGENIHPSEVENLLFEHPEVADAAVVGLPSRRWGQMVVAAVVSRHAGLSAEALDQFCQASAQLASFKRPRRYVFIDEIPASPTGKVDRAQLVERLTAQLEAPLE
ncbi:class I adenylate-forming enzyme family protein [Candidatus Entotheonella palauensis]|uniref:class I adenylate-forming enzyme family protein n=1 Tax=Candidatus Entotheonella palauensis TaxID=93172 RepID=UPI000B7E111D|nr:AMP-binding protein [Candidatus Entotheonella palauensis]